MTTLVVLDQGEPVSISFDDLLKYHGRSSIAGVAHAFKAMERAFPLLSPGGPPERHDITVESGFPGGGARDAFEMVTRAVTGDRYRLVSEPLGVEAPEAPGGHFFFRLGYRGTVVDLVHGPDSYRRSSSSSPAGRPRRRPRPFAPSSSRRRWLSDS